jgi:anti-anti-sigma factor
VQHRSSYDRSDPSWARTVRRTDHGSSTVLAVVGELDLCSAPDLTASSASLGSDVEIDLGGAAFIDAAGIRAIVAIATRCRAAGSRLRVSNVGPFHHSLFEKLGLGPLLALDMPPARTARLPGMDPDRLRSSLAELRTDLPDYSELDAALGRVTEATRHLFNADGAGIMLIDDERALEYVQPSDEGGRRLESAQRELGHGPCVDCLLLDHPVRSADVMSDPRWPGLGTLLAGADVRAVLGVPVRMAGGSVGSLNVYRSTVEEWSDAETAAIGAYAAVIEDLLGAALLAHSNEQLARQLQRALDSRVLIERAIGYQMAIDGVDPVTAFDSLRRRARAQRRKLVELAAEVIDPEPGRTRPES